MTVQDTSAKVRQDGDGVQSVFSFPFKIFTETDIEVYTVVLATGVATLKVLNTDYTVSINQITEGGTITYLTAVPTALEEFFAKRVVEDTQTTDIPNVGSIREEQIENPLDKRTMVSQQQQEEIDRSIKFAETSTVSGKTIADPETGKGVYWDASGNLVNTDDDLNDIVADATAQAVAAAASAAAAAASQAAAAASAAAALASQTAAATSASNASTSETNAAASAAAASASAAAAAASAAAALASETAAAAYATQLSGTSTTSILIGLGAKVFTTQTGKFFNAGNFLLITSDADPTNYLHGQVTSYVGTTLTMNITDIGGAGTFADWTIRLSSVAGVDGGGSDFTDLGDVPASYVGSGLFKVRVNAAETGLEFVADTGGSGGGKVFSMLLGGM
jgi:hypothetical protein